MTDFNDFAAQAFKVLIEFRDSVQESRDTLYQTRETQDLKPVHDKAIAVLLALHQAELERARRAAYDGGYDDCLREHGTVFKEKQAKP